MLLLASWGREAGAAGARLPAFLLGAGGVGAPPSPARPAAAIAAGEVSPTFPRCCPPFGGRGGPARRPLGVCRRRARAGRGRSGGRGPPGGGAHSPGEARAARAGGIWVSGRLSGRG